MSGVFLKFGVEVGVEESIVNALSSTLNSSPILNFMLLYLNKSCACQIDEIWLTLRDTKIDL
jgi:hypothetical protein